MQKTFKHRLLPGTEINDPNIFAAPKYLSVASVFSSSDGGQEFGKP